MPYIQAFLDRVMTEGFQRTNRYRCRLDLTQFGNFAGVPLAEELLREGLLCRTMITPTRTLDTTSVNFAGGYEEKYAVGTTYNDLDCTFLCPLINGTNQVLTLFHAWQNLIQNRGKVGEDANMVLTFPNEYRLEQGMRLELFSGQATHAAVGGWTVGGGNPRNFMGPVRDTRPEITTAFDYFEVYPVTVSGTTVEWDMRDEMMEVDVSFSYTHWQQVKDRDLHL